LGKVSMVFFCIAETNHGGRDTPTSSSTTNMYSKEFHAHDTNPAK